MMKKVICLLILWLSPYCMWGQTSETDSLTLDKTTRFRPQQLILPVSLGAIGAVGVASPWLKSLNRDVRNGMADLRGSHYFRADDYIQYLPVISNFGLSLFGAKAKHSYVERVLITATSYAAMGVMVNAVKLSVKEQRPDESAFNSFPSGHTATAFMGAELVRTEYKDASPLYGIGTYTIACGTAFLRIYNERHWCNDVITGAGIGILSARIGFWLLPLERKLFRLDKKRKGTTVLFCPSYSPSNHNIGGMMAMSF